MKSRNFFTWLGGCLALLLCATGQASAQAGSVTGTVTQSTSAQALEGARIQLDGTSYGAITRDNGRYLIVGVPAGSYTLVVDIIGHAEFRRAITVTDDQVTTVNVILQQDAISLQEIVVTGTAGATTKAKVPFEVASISARDIPVPSLNVASSIQGKIAGAMVVSGSGRPGTAPAILLRGPKSINAEGRDQEPLYIVDGVILGSGVQDIGGLDVERIEVVKGAAAASLYGSRAAAGVIQITTKRGSTVADQQVRYTVRSEWGRNDLTGSFPLLQHHAWRLTPDGTAFVDNNGSACQFLDCSSPQLAAQKANGEPASAWNTFATNPWPGGTFDHVDRFFEGGDWLENYVAAAGRTGQTNFHVSFSNVSTGGILTGQKGYDRINFRLNLDQQIREDLQVSASAFYSKSDESDNEGPLFDLTRMQAGIDLAACVNSDGKVIPGSNCLKDPQNLLLNTNPTNTESPNPLYALHARDFSQTRGRFLAAGNALFRPVSWLELDANLSYDRFDREDFDEVPKGYRSIQPSTTLNNGNLFFRDELRESLNASVTASTRFNLGPNISNTTKARYLFEQDDRQWNNTGGFQLAVADVPTLDNVDPETLTGSSFQSLVRSDGYFLITNFDVMDRYQIDALVRNDGSSLFGEEERRQWYYRIAGAWLLGREPWFNLRAFDELKLRYSYGTAGGRPRFEAQYETYNVASGSVSPVTLGNNQLKPEFTKEHEAGIDATLLSGRLGVTLTYAQSNTEHQILPVPLPRYTGFATQWQNAGSLQNKTWEASIDAMLLQKENLTWSARLLFDRTRSMITEISRPPFKYGVGGQGLGNVFFARAGEEIGTFYGVHYATGCGDLPSGTSCDGFAVNDDGYLVWVGSGGLGANQWGTNSGTTTVRGSQLMWGTPFRGECTDRTTGTSTLDCPVGNSLPDYSMGFSSTLSWKGFSLYGLVDAVQGFEIYNQPLQWALFRRNIGMMDQTGVSEDQQKPIGYYDALYGVSGLQPSNVFVEDGSYVKLREISVTYRFSGQQLRVVPGLRFFDGATLRLTGRNLHTWTNYRGYDPEVGSDGGVTGSAAIARVDGYRYPNFRTWKLGAELNF